MTFDDGLLDDESALLRADARLRQLAESGARVRREAVARGPLSVSVSCGRSNIAQLTDYFCRCRCVSQTKKGWRLAIP